ncbi:DUF192 domain-containing protein [Spiribacter onubensis]|uniref:DUF192 domain-containing protein n=1 Tax=Spiribacter onubensis TaxID=3122420 RepID=A0ABV3S9A3_9GAMM
MGSRAVPSRRRHGRIACYGIGVDAVVDLPTPEERALPLPSARLIRPALIILFALGLALLSHTWRSDANDTEALPEAWHSMTTAEVQIIPASGDSRWLTVRLADEADERAQGMQHLPARVVRDHPIWFEFPTPRRTGWHMRNVRIALDMAYVAPDGTVIAVERMEPGHSGYGVSEEIAAALEVAAGEAERLGIRPGTRLRLHDQIRPGN